MRCKPSSQSHKDHHHCLQMCHTHREKFQVNLTTQSTESTESTSLVRLSSFLSGPSSKAPALRLGSDLSHVYVMGLLETRWRPRWCPRGRCIVRAFLGPLTHSSGHVTCNKWLDMSESVFICCGDQGALRFLKETKKTTQLWWSSVMCRPGRFHVASSDNQVKLESTSNLYIFRSKTCDSWVLRELNVMWWP